jgi:sugar O-acyltransferase (sialic acid O-acetyltransferase NeuD family)
MKRLVLAGAGGFGREVFSWAAATRSEAGPWDDVVFLDDAPGALKATRFPAERIGSIGGYEPRDGDRVAVTVGSPAAKQRLCGILAARGARFTTLSHPTAIVGATSAIGEGCIVCPGCVVTANVRIGRHVTLNVHASVGHDAVVSDYSTIGGHADVTGGATLDEGVFLGSHAVIAPGVRVRAFAVIGAGTVAFRDVAERATVVGVPGAALGVFSRPGTERS